MVVELEANTDLLDRDKFPPEGQSNCIFQRHFALSGINALVRCVQVLESIQTRALLLRNSLG